MEEILHQIFSLSFYSEGLHISGARCFPSTVWCIADLPVLDLGSSWLRVAESGAGLHSSLLCDTSEYIFIFQKSCAEHGLNRCLMNRLSIVPIVWLSGATDSPCGIQLFVFMEQLNSCLPVFLEVSWASTFSPSPCGVWQKTTIATRTHQALGQTFRFRFDRFVICSRHFLGQLQLHSGCHGAQKPVNWVDKVSRKVIHLGYVREVVHKFAK